METWRYVREVRESLQLTQDELAQALGVSYATVNRWENGHYTPQRTTLARLRELEARMTAMHKPTYNTLLKHLKIMASGIGDELAASGPEEVATNPYLSSKAKELDAALKVIKRAEGKEE